MSNIDDYIQHRLVAQRDWHDQRARKCRRWSIALRWTLGITAAATPVLIGIDFGLREVSWAKWLPLASSAIASLASWALGQFRFEDTWVCYRRISELLTAELYLYSHRASFYSSPDAERLLVERTELILSSQQEVWQQQRSVVDERKPVVYNEAGGSTMPKFRRKPITIEAVQLDAPTSVETLEGVMQGQPGDWLVTGVAGEKYIVKDHIFRQIYEPVELAEED